MQASHYSHCLCRSQGADSVDAIGAGKLDADGQADSNQDPVDPVDPTDPTDPTDPVAPFTNFYTTPESLIQELDDDEVFEPSGIPFNPIQPNYYFAEYNMSGSITTDKQKKTVNWFANMNAMALLPPGSRPRYFPSKDGTEIYQVYDALETDEHLILYPYDTDSQSPVYIVYAGTHTPSMLLEATQLAQINVSNVSGSSYDDYPSFQTAKHLVTTVKSNVGLFPTAQLTPRELVITGFSLGGIKAIYSHYYNHAQVSKTIVFNPWVGEWIAGFTTDPKDHLNPWHDARLAELHALSDSPVPGGFTNLYVNYIAGEFASKYWQGQSMFNVAWDPNPQTLAIGWGINFKYPGGFPFDNLPNTLSEILIHGTKTGHDHAIKNWEYSNIDPVSTPQLFVSGRKVISTLNAYVFPRHSTGQTPIHYKWANLNGSIQLNLLSDGTIETIDQYIFDFEPQGYSGLTSISSVNDISTGFNYQLEDAGDGYYYIRNSQGQYSYFDSTRVESGEFKNEASPSHLGIEWNTVAQFNYASDKNPYKWIIEGEHVLDNTRRNIDPSTYDAMADLKANDDISWVIQSDRGEIATRYMEPLTGTVRSETNNIGFVFPGSQAASLSPSGIQWMIEYNPTTLSYKIYNKSDPSIIMGNFNMKQRSRTWSTDVQAEGTSTDTWLEANQLSDTELTIESVPGSDDTFYIKRDWSTPPSGGDDRPQYIAIATDWSPSPTEPFPNSDVWGNEDAIQWFNMHGPNYEELPVFHWGGLERFRIRQYDPGIDPVEATVVYNSA